MYVPIEDIEPFERYTAGGYFPVELGDQFCSSRYRIVHKLGHGASSTIWLARDAHLHRYVAMKFLVSDLDHRQESSILDKLRDGQNDYTQSNAQLGMIPELLDEFQVEGPDIQGVTSKHRCLVMLPARMSISDARDASINGLFQPPVAHAIAAQLVESVAFLHSRGIVHGDLHEANILLCLPYSIDGLSEEELRLQYGEPHVEQVERFDGKPLDLWVPLYGVSPIWLGDASDNLSLRESRISLIDFGESFQVGSAIERQSHTPLVLRSPELLLKNSQVSFASEVWSLACAVFKIMGQELPFDLWFPIKDELFVEQVDALGSPPQKYWQIWSNRSQFFDDDIHRLDGELPRPLEVRLEESIQEPRKESGMLEMDNDEKEAFLKLMKGMLSYVPDDRPSAEQVLESEWMRKWALPAFDSIKGSLET